MVSSYQDCDNLLHYPQGTDTALKTLNSSSPVFLIPVKRETTLIFGAWIDNLVAVSLGFPGGSDSKKSTCNEGDLGSIPGSGRFPGEGNGNPLQYSCLANPMDREVWWVTVRGVAESVTTE